MSFSHFVKIEFTPERKDLLKYFLRGAAICCKAGQAGIDLIIPILLPPVTGNAPTVIARGSAAVKRASKCSDSLLKRETRKFISGVFTTSPYRDSTPHITRKLAQTILSREKASLPPESGIFELDNMSFLLIQVKNRKTSESESDAHLGVVYPGLIDAGDHSPPYLAIRHELRLSPGLELMEKVVGRVGLVMKGLSEETSPCLKYRSEEGDRKVSELIGQILDTNVQAIEMCDELSDRLVIGYASFTRELSISTKFLDELSKIEIDSDENRPKKKNKGN
jgi:hypothetical protein